MDIKYLDQIEDHIKKEFVIERYIGQRSYGSVWKVNDPRTNKKYAIKKIFGAFRNCTDAKRTVREVSFLSQLSHHKNIIKLEKVIKSQNKNDLYLVFEYLESDLHKVIRQEKLLLIHQGYIIYQILLVLQYLHSGGIIHRDLKPSNLLINKSCIIKLADFGLARCFQDLDQTNPVYTENAATRSYQAPEILFGSKHYSQAVDMWSVGCILFEMLTGKVMFKEETQLNQISRIIEFLGIPNDQDIQSFQLVNPEILRSYIVLFQSRQTIKWNQILNSLDSCAKDFIINCIKYNPQQRMTAQQALQHPYVLEFKGKFKEQLSDIQFISLKNDEQLYSVQEYQDILYQFIDFKGGDIYQFKSQYNNRLSGSVQNRQIETSNTLQAQFNDTQNTLCENKTEQFHQPLVSNDTKKMSLNYQNNPSKKTEENHYARRLSLQTNYSQSSSSDNQDKLIKQSEQQKNQQFEENQNFE